MRSDDRADDILKGLREPTWKMETKPMKNCENCKNRIAYADICSNCYRYGLWQPKTEERPVLDVNEIEQNHRKCINWNKCASRFDNTEPCASYEPKQEPPKPCEMSATQNKVGNCNTCKKGMCMNTPIGGKFPDDCKEWESKPVEVNKILEDFMHKCSNLDVRHDFSFSSRDPIFKQTELALSSYYEKFFREKIAKDVREMPIHMLVHSNKSWEAWVDLTVQTIASWIEGVK